MAISVLLLWWALHDISFADFVEQSRSIRLLPLAGCVVVATLTFPLRAIRWRYLLRLDGEALPFAPLWHATAIGFMANNLLLARAGEVARAYAASRLTSVRFTNVVATLVVERAMDGLTLVAILAVAIIGGGFDAQTPVGFTTLGTVMTVATAGFVAVLVVAVAAVHWPQ